MRLPVRLPKALAFLLGTHTHAQAHTHKHTHTRTHTHIHTQVRVKNSTCNLGGSELIYPYVKNCYGDYSNKNEDRAQYGPINDALR